MYVSQDPRIGNGQRVAAFWERVWKHYLENRPFCRPEKLNRSLETKWGSVKHDVAKFCGVYKTVLNSRESGTSLEDVLERALDLYKVRHPKQQPFVFVHYWRILRDVPHWCDSIVAGNSQPRRPFYTMPKQKGTTPPCPKSSYSTIYASGEEEGDVEAVAECRVPKRPMHPTDQKAAKEADRVLCHREIAVQA